MTSQQPTTRYPSTAHHAPAPRTNTLAIVSLVLAFLALSQVKSRSENGRGLALGAVIVGGGITALYVVLLVAVVVIGSSAPAQY